MLGRRLAALLIDWGSCLLVSYAFFDADAWATLAIFAVLQVLTVGTVGSSPGHRLLGLRVTRLDGNWAGPVPVAVRTVLLCLFVPAVIMVDGRGLHDVAARTRIGPLRPSAGTSEPTAPGPTGSR